MLHIRLHIAQQVACNSLTKTVYYKIKYQRTKYVKQVRKFVTKLARDDRVEARRLSTRLLLKIRHIEGVEEQPERQDGQEHVIGRRIQLKTGLRVSTF